MKRIDFKSILLTAFLVVFCAFSVMTVSADEIGAHRHVWIMTEEESPIHDVENGGHRQTRECAVTVNGERCTETRVFYVRRPGCALCAAKDGECTHSDYLYIGEQSAHPHYKVYECQECGYQFTNGTMANWHWNDYSTSPTHTPGLGHAITQKCSKCNATQNGGYDTNYSGCCQCGNHLFVPGYTQYSYSSTHPHAEYYICEVCDATVYTGNYYSGDYPGCSSCHVHDFSYSYYYQSAHPHYRVNVCSCGAEQVTSTTSVNTSCCQCGYHSYSYSYYYQTAHPHYRVNVCSCGAEQVTSTTSVNTSCCQCGYHNYSYSYYYQTAHPHYRVNVCSCGAEQVTSITSTNTSCCQCNSANPHSFNSGICIYCEYEPSIANGVYKIKSVYNGLYVDVKDGGTSSGTDVQQWSGTSNDGNRNQLFKITYLGTHGNGNEYYSIRPMVNSGLGLYSDYSSTDYAKVNSMSVTDNSDISYYQRWTIVNSGSGYKIKNGTANSDSCLTVQANNSNGSLISTQNYIASRSDWILERYTGEAIHGVTFSAYTEQLIPTEMFTFSAAMYCSQTGVNGPVTYDVRNVDGTVTDKATINSSTGVLTALQTGRIQVRATYTGAPSVWYGLVDIEKSLEGDNGYCIVNDYMNPSDNYNRKFITGNSSFSICQSNIDPTYTQKWIFTYEGEGYYRILNSYYNRYLTSPDDDISGSVITLSTQMTGDDADRQLWRFNRASGSLFQIKAKNQDSNVIAPASSGSGIVQGSSDGSNTYWRIPYYASIREYGGTPSRNIAFQYIPSAENDTEWYQLVCDAVTNWNATEAGVSFSVSTGTSSHTIRAARVSGERWFGACGTSPNYSFCATASAITLNISALEDITLSSSYIPILSTITHEMGHVITLEDNPEIVAGESLMSHGRNRQTLYVPQTYDIYNVKAWYDD